MREVKVVVLGDKGVGKSSLSIRLANDTFIEEIDQEEDYYHRVITVDSTAYLLQILDTIAISEPSSMRNGYLRTGTIYILCYSITSKPSLDVLDTLVETIKINSIGRALCVLVGCKSDLEDQRMVSYEEGKAFSDKHNTYFYEASAKLANNVEEVFTEPLEEFIKIDAAQNPERRNKRK